MRRREPKNAKKQSLVYTAAILLVKMRRMLKSVNVDLAGIASRCNYIFKKKEK
jgi:hypothetical protein